MKSKKWISVLLALVMVLTVIPLTVFAQATTTQEVSDMMAAYSTKWNGFTAITTANKTAKEADSLAILDAYQELPNDDAKDALGNDNINNLCVLIYHYLRSAYGTTTANAAYIDNYVASNIATANMLEAQRLAKIIYGGTYGLDYAYTKTDGTAGTIKFATNTDFTNADNKKAYEDFLAELKAANALVKEYIVLFNTSLQFANTAPYTHVTQRAVLLNINYLVGTGIAREAASLKTMQEYDALGADYTAGFQLILKGLEALQAYEASGNALDVSKFAGLKAEFEALPKAVANMLNTLNTTTSSGYPIGTVNGSLIAPANVRSIALTTDTFVNVINDMVAYDLTQPSNATVKAIRASVSSFASILKTYIMNAAFNARYDAIFASYQNVTRPERDNTIPSKAGYTKATVDYAKPANKSLLNLSFTALNPLVSYVVDLAVGDISDLMYTNAMVGTLAGLNSFIYDMVKQEAENMGEIDVLGMKMDAWELLQEVLGAGGALPTPQTLARQLTEAEYADVSAKLATLANWSEFNAADYNWGVTDGDRESFVKAAVAVLRPITALFYYYAEIPDTFTGDVYNDFVADGTYETVVIPLLEALGCRGIISADEFTANTLKLPNLGEGSVYGKRHDALGEALLNPILNLLEDIIANPLPTILDLLPRLAYAEQNGELDPLFGWELDLLGFYRVEFMPIRSLQDLVGMVAGSLPITLPQIDWAYLAHLGTLEHKASANGKTVYKNFVIADRADVFTYLTKYLGTILEDDANFTAIGDMIFNAIGVRVSGKDLVALRTACKSGNSLDTAYVLTNILEGLIIPSQSEGSCACGQDSECGCTCTGDTCDPGCPCGCEGCPPPETELNFFEKFFQAIFNIFRKFIEFIQKLFK